MIQRLIDLIPACREQAVVVAPLSGGLTNHNFRINAGSESYVLRISGENSHLLGIDRRCEHACSMAAAELDKWA